MQIEQGTGRHALHIAQLAQRALLKRGVVHVAADTGGQAAAVAASAAP